MSGPERILLVRLSHLGDVVHALGVFHALHQAFPDARIAWAVQREFAELVAPLPGLAEVVAFDRHGGAGAWWRLRRELARLRADWAVDAQGNAKSGAVAWLSRAARRIAPAREDWQEPWAAWTATEHAPGAGGRAAHAMLRMERLARHLVPGLALPLRLDAALTADERAAGERALDARLAPGTSGHVLLHLSSPGDVRGWPPARWRELVLGLRARGLGVLVLSGPAEAALGAELARESTRDGAVAHWIGQRGLRALAALFAAAGARGLALVACDSGPMHLAAAHGLRVVALEGPQDGARTGPWPLAATGAAAWDGAAEPRHRVVRAARAPACAPCLSRRCSHADGPVCMAALEPADVVAALD